MLIVPAFLLFLSQPCLGDIQFPQGHPDGAASSTFKIGYGSSKDIFNIYLWRENYAVPQLTKEMKNQAILLSKLNPAVYEAVQKSSSYASFFRYVKINYNANWKAFVKSISGVNIVPVVKTPTKMPKNSF